MRLRASSSRPAVVLIAVLIVVVLLSLAAYKYNDLMTAEYRATDSSFRAAQARAYATSGVHYTAALLSSDLDQTASGNPWDNTSLFQNISVPSTDKNARPGRFSILTVAPSDDPAGAGQGYRYGLCDEASKINVNALLLLAQSGKSGKSGSSKGGSATASAAGANSATGATTTVELGKLVLMALPNMTEDVANAILDWIDPNDPKRDNGAKDTYYNSLSPPYRCKNGPLDSLEEMLLIKGVTPQLLFGNDKNRNGILDADEDGSGQADLGWSAYLTVHSREANFDNSNQPRLYLNDSSLDTVANALPAAVGDDLANFIIAARLYGIASNTISFSLTTSGKIDNGTTNFAIFVSSALTSSAPLTQADKDAIAAQIATDREKGDKKLEDIKSLWSLVNAKVDVKITDASTGKQTTKSLPSPLNSTDQQSDLLPKLLDKCTTTQVLDLTPRLNLNTASPTALKALLAAFQVSEADAQKVIDTQPSPTATSTGAIFKTPAWLLTEAKLPLKTIKLLEPFITTRSQVYRFQSVGYADRGGPITRIEAIVDANQGRPRIVYWRDLSELGKGFDIPAAGN